MSDDRRHPDLEIAANALQQAFVLVEYVCRTMAADVQDLVKAKAALDRARVALASDREKGGA